jgi:DNA-directed RNA polymerase specialized sigma24 family protein
MTIAANTLVDAARRERPSAELAVEPGGEDPRPAFEELAPLTDGLPPKERAAVVLRYGYALDYDEIGAALGSSEDAARQAASAGVRRLRKEKSK